MATVLTLVARLANAFPLRCSVNLKCSETLVCSETGFPTHANGALSLTPRSNGTLTLTPRS